MNNELRTTFIWQPATAPLHLSRTLYKFTLFMQNKPNFPRFCVKNAYSEEKQTQFKPNQTQRCNPHEILFNPSKGQFLRQSCLKQQSGYWHSPSELPKHCVQPSAAWIARISSAFFILPCFTPSDFAFSFIVETFISFPIIYKNKNTDGNISPPAILIATNSPPTNR